MVKGRYIGPRPDLKDKTALLRFGTECVLAQFDDRSLHEAYGWTQFECKDFDYPVYWVFKPKAGLFELRQSRFREMFRYGQGTDHPHDVCAVATSVELLKQAVQPCNLGSVDWEVYES